MSAATNSNESYCTFTLASDVTAGGLPSEEEIARQLESSDPKVRLFLCCLDIDWRDGVLPQVFVLFPSNYDKGVVSMVE